MKQLSATSRARTKAQIRRIEVDAMPIPHTDGGLLVRVGVIIAQNA